MYLMYLFNMKKNAMLKNKLSWYKDLLISRTKLNFKRLRLSSFLLLFCSVIMFAENFPLLPDAVSQQQITITGTVSDTDGNALPGVNVMVKGTSQGTATDADGKYVLSVPYENATLVFSYIGFISQEITVGNQRSIHVTMREDATQIEEVVVVGYGTMKKRDVTGSITSVSSEKMSAYTVSNPIMALQGRAAGVVVTTNTGEPNGDFTVRIRGTNSIRGGNDPLYIIDGMPANASSINSLDIESVEILKDASATAIYGTRAANGVVLITTKRAKDGTSSVTYDFNYGMQSQIKKIDMMDATEWGNFVNEHQMINVGREYFTQEQIASFGKGTDWQDLIFQNAPIQNHNLQVMGGTGRAKVLFSASAMLRDGLIPNSNYDKYNMRVNVDYKISNMFDLQVNMGFTRTDRQNQSSGGGNRGGSLIGAVYVIPPTLTPYNDDGSYRELRAAYPFMSNVVINPMNIINEVSSKTRENLVNNAAALIFKPIDGLSFKVSFGIENNDYRGDDYSTNKRQYTTSSASVSTNQQTTILNDNILNYNKTIAKDHFIDLTGVFSYQQYLGTSTYMSGTGFLSDAPETGQIGAASNFGVPSTGYTKWVLLSYLGRANYSYKGKYMATVSIRADGSSRYAEGNKWGYFPSAALAWRISEEGFLKDIRQLSDFKIRLGYGKTGSTAIDPYSTLNMLSMGSSPIGSGNGTYYAANTTLPSPLKWETTSQYNIGLDVSLFSNRLRMTADLYDKTTNDLLNSVYMPPSSGYTTTLANIGAMSNRGFELMINGDVLKSSDLLWTLTGNVAFNQNRVKKLYEGDDIYGSSYGLSYINDFIHLIREGEPVNVFFTYKEDGYTDTGNLKHVDVDGNGVMSIADKFITGTPHPKCTYGFNSDLFWKGIEFTVFFQGSYGNNVFNVGEAANLDYSYPNNMRKEVMDHWKATNTAEQNASAKYPAIDRNLALQYSDRYVEDASYLRLKNISLGYNLPLQKWGMNWVKVLKVYLSAQNMLTFTKYSGMDPDVNTQGGTTGMDYLRYPKVKTVTIGAKVQF